MSFISEIDNFTIYKLKRNLDLGSLLLKQNECVCMFVEIIDDTRVVFIRRYNKQTRSFITASLPSKFTYKKYFAVDEDSTNQFIESMSEYDTLYCKVSDMKSHIKTAFSFTALTVALTVIAVLCNASDYLHSISSKDDMMVFTYMGICGGILSIILAIITSLTVYRQSKLNTLYNSYYDKCLRKLLRKLR